MSLLNHWSLSGLSYIPDLGSHITNISYKTYTTIPNYIRLSLNSTIFVMSLERKMPSESRSEVQYIISYCTAWDSVDPTVEQCKIR